MDVCDVIYFIQVIYRLALQSVIPSSFSAIVPSRLSAAWLSYSDLLCYLSKDTEAASALVLGGDNGAKSSERLERRK